MDSQRKSAKMFVTFEELWSSGRSLLLVTGPSAASSLLWVTPLIAAPAHVLPAVPVGVSIASVAASSARSADSLSQSRKWIKPCHSSWISTGSLRCSGSTLASHARGPGFNSRAG